MKAIHVDPKLIHPEPTPVLITSPNLETVDDLPAAMMPDGAIISRWQPTDEERQAVAAGADIYVLLYTNGRPYPPMCVIAGKR